MMMSAMSPGSDTPWSIWKRDWIENLMTAAVAGCLEAGAFSLFVHMFVGVPHSLLSVVAGGAALFWVLHMGVSSLNAYLLSDPVIAASVGADPSQ